MSPSLASLPQPNASAPTRRALRLARHALVTSLVLAYVLFASIGFAQSPQPADPEAEAAEHHRRATEAFTARNYALAGTEFESAYALVQDPSLLFDAAVAWERLPDAPRAIADFQHYLSVAPNAPNRPDVESRIDVLQRTIARERALAASSEPPPSHGSSAAPAPARPPPQAPIAYRVLAISSAVLALGAGVSAAVLYETTASRYQNDLSTCAPHCGSAEASSISLDASIVNGLIAGGIVLGAVAVVGLVLDLHARSSSEHVSVGFAPLPTGGGRLTVGGSF